MSNGVPSLRTIVAAMLVMVLVGGLIAWQRRGIEAVLAWGAQRRTQMWLGTAFVVVCGGLLLLGGLRPRLFGADYAIVRGVPQRTYDEVSLIRLSWFFTLPGLALMLAGIGYVAVRRWRFDRWLVALPAVGLLTLYCYHVRNSPYLMWATRRFVTSVVPSMVLLIGCGVTLGFLVIRRLMNRGVGVVAIAAAIVALTVFNLSESWPLRSHNENGGSIEVEKQVAALAGDQRGVYLWEHSTVLLCGPMDTLRWPATHHRQSVERPAAHDSHPAGSSVSYVNHFARLRATGLLRRRSERCAARCTRRNEHEGSSVRRRSTALGRDLRQPAEDHAGLYVFDDCLPADRELTMPESVRTDRIADVPSWQQHLRLNRVPRSLPRRDRTSCALDRLAPPQPVGRG